MGRLLARPRRYGTPVLLCVAAATFAALAANSAGFPVQHVNLNDGGIWVTNNALGLVGRFDKPIGQLDGIVTATSAQPELDVVQNGPLVAAWDQSAGRVYSVDVYTPSFGDTSAPLAASQVALGGSTLAVLGINHSLRTTSLSASGGSLAGLASPAGVLASHLPANAAIGVAADGTVYVADGGRLKSYPAGNEAGGQPASSAMPLPAADPMQVTTVGNVPVVADTRTKTIYLPGSGHTIALPGSDHPVVLELQQSSGPSNFVVAATTTALYSIDLATGHVTTLSTGHSGDVAAPVQVAGCVHAAWGSGTTGSYVRSCGGVPPTASSEQSFPLDDPSPSLVFRVNYDEVVLNDTTNGGVFLVDSTVTSAQPQWQPSGHTQQNKKAQISTADQASTPVVAKPYTQGVRPGRTTVVHVLDNDSGPRGSVLAITALGAPDKPQVSVKIAADAQTILATVATGLTTDAHFSYTIDDGHGHTAEAEVTLVPRGADQNKAPQLRPGYQQPVLTVDAGGSLTIPVIGDWRDYDGDPLYVVDNSAGLTASAGSVSVTAGGAIAYAAPQTTAGMVATIHYGVSDGIVTRPTPATLTVHVLGSASTDLVPPTAEPDVAVAVVGSPLTLNPLANDLPGADPTNPDAQLTLAAPVAAVPGLAVTSDIHAGTVTVTAGQPGTYFLSYEAAFGAARVSRGTIRIQASAAGTRPEPPIAVPDVAILYGQQPAVVDVLANDYDPQGWVLGIVGASSPDPAIHVAVVGQQWLRITADNPVPGLTSTVTYTVSDGYGTATGTVSVVMTAATGSDEISTHDDSVVVRAGDSAAVAVLANDSSSADLPLALDPVEPAAAPAIPGLLASVQGNDVRVTAPASARVEETTTVSYVATDASGAMATGYLHVTIEPPPSKARPNQPPQPQDIQTRETAGNVLIIPIPTSGIDPDGDSTTVTAVTVPPSLGRIVAIGPDTITYQSYPYSVGTDTFSYQVTDPYGATGTAEIHVGILPPGQPQPPIAVDDIVNAPPGVMLHVDVLANDYIAPGDPATIVPLSQTNPHLPAGVRLSGSFVYVRAPAEPSDPPVEVTYGVTDGSSAPSLGHLIVRAVPGAQLPPVANDVIAPTPAHGARTVTVNVLRHDDDPVGSAADLKITSVPAGTKVSGGNLTIPLTAEPRQIPYQITASDGLTATAVVYVPGTETSAITVRPGARITLAPHGTVTVPLSSVLSDAAGRKLRITTTDQLTASPAGDVTVTAHQASAFVVSAVGSYTGPGAVTVQVYDGTSLQDPHGHTATLTIPVQVGPDLPVLRCPQAALPVSQGGSAQTYDIGQLCNVWVDTTVSSPAPRYTVSWVKSTNDVSASIVGGTALRLTAGSGAQPGTVGQLRITPVGGTVGSAVGITVIAAPLPTGRSVTLTALAGQRVSVDLSQYVSSVLARPRIDVLHVSHPGDAAVGASGSVVTITPGADTHGMVSVTATVTDAPGVPNRAINVLVTVEVIGRPGAPGRPSATATSRTIVVSFGPAADNGAPIDHYSVYTNGAPHDCPASPCTITGLQNNTRYEVYVTAHNAVGSGPASSSTSALPNQVPDQVTGLETKPGDTEIGLSWRPAVVDGSPVTSYVAEISPAPATGSPIVRLGGSATSATFTGLTNGTSYSFRVEAVNTAGAGPWSPDVTDIPFGKPLTMPAPTAAGAAVPDPAITRAITVTWAAGNDNGRAITGYTVREYRSATAGGPWTLAATVGPLSPGAFGGSAGSYQQSFTVANDGTWYEYTVTATNAAGESPQSPQSAPPVQGAAPPDAPANLTAADHDAGSDAGYNGAIHVAFTVPEPNSAQLSSVQYGLNGTAVSGSWTAPGAPGSNVDEAITGLTNGTSYVVYVRGCNDAGLCGPWTGPSNQVIPYGPPAAPSVSATQDGESIVFSWGGGGGNGRAVDHYYVCFDGGSCIDTAAGSTTKSYGYSQTHTVTAYVVDTAGQQSATASASATTVAAPAMTVTLSEGPGEDVTGCTDTSICKAVDVAVTNAPAGATMNYACYDNGVQFWPTSGTTDENWNGAVVKAGANGSVSWQSQCVWGYWGNSAYHLQVKVNGTESP